MSIKTRKIKLIPVGETTKERSSHYAYIRRIADDLSRVGNEVIRLHVGNQYELDRLTNGKTVTKGEATKILTESLGTSIRNSGYQQMSKFNHVASTIRTCFNSVIFKTISENFYDILNGKMSIPSFRKTNLSIPFSAQNDSETKITKVFTKTDDNKYHIGFPMTLEERKNHGEIKFNLFFGKDRSNNRVIVDRIMDGTYKLCDSNFKIIDSDIYLMMTYDQPTTPSNDIDYGKVMGIDLGINRPVSYYISGEKHQPQQIQIGEKIQHERMKHYKTRHSIQQTLKYSTGGHGRKKKLKGLEHQQNKEKEWSKRINNNISREVINVAQQYNVGLIKMEDLTGITTSTNDYFLKSWAYYQLQTMIEYKAKEVGIRIEWVNPKNTSNTCPTCKTSDPLNRNDKDKTKFTCINNECKDFDKLKDADIVAAHNITYTESSEVKGRSKQGRMEKGKKRKEELLNL